MAKYVIFKLDSNPEELVMSWDSAYNVSLTTTEGLAAVFDSEQEANDMIANFEGTTDFWGSRPKRP